MELLNFIKANKDWEKILKTPPYNISIKEKRFGVYSEFDSRFILFNYNQINSDFSIPIVRECRGCILKETSTSPFIAEEKKYKIVCFPFTKFFNYGESLAAYIDWPSARIQEKVDGSIIKVWYNYNIPGSWMISTNGTINAFEAIANPDKNLSFGDLFYDAALKQELYFNNLDKDYTYIFELTSPYNRIVVPYPTISITHIGTRNNKTEEEVDIDIGIKKPKLFSFSSKEDTLDFAKNLKFTEGEGFVVVDKNWNRIKIKGDEYVNLHHLKNNGAISYERILNLIRKNEHSEFLSYFPEYKNDFDLIENSYKDFIFELHYFERWVEEWRGYDRKIFASKIKDFSCPAIGFYLYDRKGTVEDFIEETDTRKLLSWLKIKEKTLVLTEE